LEATPKLSAFLMFIQLGARFFGLTIYGVNGNIWDEELLLGLPGGEYGFLIAVTILIFILGCFLDFFEIAFILVPLLAPVADKLGIDLVWFGIIIGLNLQASFLTPPFGFALFYLRSVAPPGPWRDAASGRTLPGIKTTEIYRGALPFIGIQILMIAIVIAYPPIVTHYKDEPASIDPGDVQFELPPLGGSGGGLEGPPAGLPLPDLGMPPPGLGQPSDENGSPDPAAPPAFDLSQPPRFN
ncbi:MAG: TRAP transporter large permease subunit, partial [Bauldia litoralis]